MLCKLLSKSFFYEYDRVDSDTNALCVSARTTFHDQHLSRDIPQLSRYFCDLETLKLLKKVSKNCTDIIRTLKEVETWDPYHKWPFTFPRVIFSYFLEIDAQKEKNKFLGKANIYTYINSEI
jgi:hypothetical protein